VRVVDDWNALGQRTTASGGVFFADVHVAAAYTLAVWQLADRPGITAPRPRSCCTEVFRSAVKSCGASSAAKLNRNCIAHNRTGVDAASRRLSRDRQTA
jgi:alkylation response protein AidB-like acyl-CoA dehydrogenase